MSTATQMIDEAKRRAEMQHDIFGKHLQEFVREWAPEDRYRRDRFQRDLMNLFVGAMRNQTSCMNYGLSNYVAQQWIEASMRPLHMIMEEPKK